MAKPWDTRSLAEQAKSRDAALTDQVTNGVGPFSPYYRDLFKAAGVRARSVTTMAALQAIPASGERDVCPDGNPADAARLVLQADEAGWAQHAAGDRVRRGLLSRARGAGDYRRQVEAAVRPTTYHFGGLGVSFPVASTRHDLDLVARAGARMWAVLGLTSADVLVSAVPLVQRVDDVALSYAALGAGAPALLIGDDADAVADTLAMVPATAVALPAGYAAAFLDEVGSLPDSVRTIVIVGGPTVQERADVADRAPSTRVLGAWGPPDGRLLYAEAEPGGGYVTYPDLDIWELVDPDTGATLPHDAPYGGELTLTQLGFRGSALLRWRTGTTVSGPLLTEPAGGRTVPRLPSDLDVASLVPVVTLEDVPRAIDLRHLSGALAARQDLAAFRLDLVESERTGDDQLIVTIAPRDRDAAATAAAVAATTRRATGARVTQVVVDTALA